MKLAGTSYSQFIAHFRDKRGVLCAILQQAWGEINTAIRLAVSKTFRPADRLKLTIDVLLSYLERDQQFRPLFLIEITTTRENGTVAHNAGFSDFMDIVDGIVQDMRGTGGLPADVHSQLLRSAIVGALQGMLRDQLIAEQIDSAASHSELAIRAVLSRFVASAARSGETLAASLIEVGESAVEVEGDQEWIGRYLDLAALALGPPGNA